MAISKFPSFKAFLLATTMVAFPLTAAAPSPAAAQIVLTVQIEPPALPIYVQPPIPEVGYIWTPGYWAYDAAEGYYWVPGTWVQPPEIAVLWTPPYWGFVDGAYAFHEGYWGPHVGFYGGVNYGFGYGGDGYQGGRWDGGHFAYNRTVNNFGETRITNVYESNVTIVNTSRVSFVGGRGGLTSVPNAQDRVAEHENHLPVTSIQTSHVSAAARNPELAVSHNNGRPPIAATSHPGQFQGPGVSVARAAGGRSPVPVAASRPAVAQPQRIAPNQPLAGHPEPARAAFAPHPAEHAVTSPSRPAERGAAPPQQQGRIERPTPVVQHSVAQTPRPAPPRAAPPPQHAAQPRPTPAAAKPPAGKKDDKPAH